MSGELDAAADGQFTGKLADPADTLTKRGGKGAVVFEGVCYTRVEWVRRSARLGHTLAAGEGTLLEAEIVELTEVVKLLVRAAAAQLQWLPPDDLRRVLAVMETLNTKSV